MKNIAFVLVVLLGMKVAAGESLFAQKQAAEPSRFYAVSLDPQQMTFDVWGIATRAGGAQEVGPYLSTLVMGEAATGRFGGPAFTLEADRVTFEINGHDGAQGNAGKNRIELCDAATGEVLRQTFAPGNDLFQELFWETADLSGRSVAIFVEDAENGGAFAWMGVRKIDAGDACRVDFSGGKIPAGWKMIPRDPQEEVPARILTQGDVPFAVRGSFPASVVPNERQTVVGVGGLTAARIHLLGCTTTSNQILLPGATLDLYYNDGAVDHVPLMYGFTLAYRWKTDDDGTFVRPYGSGNLGILSVTPQAKPLEKIGFTREKGARPEVLAVTLEGVGAVFVPDALAALPETTEKVPVVAEDLSVSSTEWKKQFNAAEIFRRHGVPYSPQEWQKIESPTPVKFRKIKISDRAFEAAGVADINGDGLLDIISGEYWYEGPDFKKEYRYASVPFDGNYYDDFSDLPLDVNGDGAIDVVSGGWNGRTLRWHENPKGTTATLWPVHEIDQPGSIETTRIWDLDGDGVPEIVPNAGADVVFYRLNRDANGKGDGTFTKHLVARGKGTHGIGCGDINGDGHPDLVNAAGWFEAPKNLLDGEWIFHPEFNLGTASVPILVVDVTGNGTADLIYGAAHGYGIFWLEQVLGKEGTRQWLPHEIDLADSQYHDLILADLDGDGAVELISGKRYYAHCGHDPGAEDPLHLRFWNFRRGQFSRHTIDYGPLGTASGLGIAAAVADLDGDGHPDLVAPGKEGLFLFFSGAKK